MTMYTVSHAYRLGDYYKESYQWLAAELCYALPSIKDHAYNSKYARDIEHDKLRKFIQFRNANDFVPPHKNTDIPSEASVLIKSFYSLWLNNQIKKELIKRSKEHTSKRCETIIKIFKQVTNHIHNIGDLDISWIENDVLSKHQRKIHQWKGPSFTKLQYKKNSNKLTVVMEYKDYRNRCMNSQEDWFKKYDGIFFAQCLEEIVQTLKARLSCNAFAAAALIFAKELLFCKIQFPLAAAKLLLPAGTLFGCKALQDVLMKFHPKLNCKLIRQQSQSNRSVDYHKELLKICQHEYTLTISQNVPISVASASASHEVLHERSAQLGELMCDGTKSVYSDIHNNNVWDVSSINSNYPYLVQYPYQSPVMIDPNMTHFVPHTNTILYPLPNAPSENVNMNGDTGSVISICTECGEQQCRCQIYAENASTTGALSVNLQDGHRLFQATNFPHIAAYGIAKSVHQMRDNRSDRVSLHVNAMRNINMPASHPIFGNTQCMNQQLM